MTGQSEKREAALAQLKAENPHDRYRAAKALCTIGIPEDVNFLMSVRKQEVDSSTIRWIDNAIRECTKRGVVEKEKPPALSIDATVGMSQKAQATHSITTVLMHEIGAKIGLLDAVAQQEVENYDTSDTAAHIRNLVMVFDGITELRKAASTPNIAEFDLAALIESIVSIEANGGDVDVSLVGRKPLLLMSDPNLLRLALCNGIRNAVEAVRQVPGPLVHGIIINWGSTDSDFWVSVIDQGPGLIPGSAFDLFKTTKKDHTGFGLAIARQAMEKLNGTVTLVQSPGGGATYEIKGKLDT